MNSGLRWLLVAFLVIGVAGGGVQAGSLDVPCKYDLSSAQKDQVIQWLNSSSEQELQSAFLSASVIKKVLTVRPFTSWNHMWTQSSIGSNTPIRLILVKLGIYQNPYDCYTSRPPVRIRPQDRQAIINWANNATLSQMEAIGLTQGTRLTKIPMNRPFRDWEHLMAIVTSDNDIVKIGTKVGSARYVSGSTAIETISGIGAQYGGRFRAIKLVSTQQFLCASVWPEWRAEIAQKVNLGQGFIDRWAKRADLNRISGIGEQYGDLLAYAGVHTVPDLVGKDPVALRNLMIEKNAQYNLVNTMPSLTTVKSWVARAAKLPRMLEF